ncbi:MAG: betaine--homocysteine S-methyltransferase [Acidimicrobiales bacterium]
MSKFLHRLDDAANLLVDGAMGTELFTRGLTAGDPPEMWNVDRPDAIESVHAGYIEAGSDIILTNSFGGTAFRLALHRLEDRVHELNERAAQIARRAADASDRPVVVAGSIGPSGELLEPLGAMTPDGARAAFAAQAAGLVAGGADVLWVETMSSLDEVDAAVRGIREVTDVPIAVTMSFDTASRTMMGVTGQQAAEHLVELGVAALGANCGNNVADTERAAKQLVASAGSTPVIVKANAGIPVFEGDALTYSGSPEVMGAHVARMVELGVQIIGGCCGTSTEHLGYMRQVLDGVVEPPAIEAPGPDRDEVAPAGARRSRRRRG